MPQPTKSVYGSSGRRAIYGDSKTPQPCTYTIPPELDINVYMLRAISAISSISDVQTKKIALTRLTNISTDITTIVNN
jgi:hypothetical protein